MPPAGFFLEARIHLRRAVALPGPVPRQRLEIDAADDRARARQMIGDRAGEIESLVGNEHRVEIAIDGAQERGIILLAVAGVGAGLEMLIDNYLCAEFLRRMRK